MRRLPGDDSGLSNLVGCTDHMCPVRVHWHVKSNYRDRWRVKVTVSNYHFANNFSDWNLVIQHPGFGQPARSYSFNSTRLAAVGDMAKSELYPRGCTPPFGGDTVRTSENVSLSLWLDIAISIKHGAFVFSAYKTVTWIDEKSTLIMIINFLWEKKPIPTEKRENNMSSNDAGEAAIFWGIEYYNKELLQAGNSEPGSVMTEIDVQKDPESFTLRSGWAFPRKVYFNGEICELPMPDDFPGLPNTASSPSNAYYITIILFPLILLFH